MPAPIPHHSQASQCIPIQVCIQVGCVPPACTASGEWGVCWGGGISRGSGVSAPGGVFWGVGCAPGGGVLFGGGVDGSASRTGGCIPACNGADAPHCEQNCWHKLLKILPCPNFVAGGNKCGNKWQC